MGKAPARLAALFLLAVLPLALRLGAVDHGLPRNYLPDTHAVRAALGMARDKDPVPPVGKYSTYPNLVPYMLLPVYGAQYAFGRVNGQWGGVAEYAERAILEPARVHLPARLLVACLGALTVWVTYRAARAAGLKGGAPVAAYLVATGLLHLHFSVQERPWVPTVFFGAVAVWACIAHARALRETNDDQRASPRRPRALYLAAAASGLAFACHQVGLAFLGLCGLAWLLAPFERGALRQRIAQGFVAVAVFLAIGIACGHAYYLRYGGIASESLSGGAQAGEFFSIGGQAVRFEVSWSSLTHMARAFFGYDPVLVSAGCAGLGVALVHPRLRACALFALVYGLFFLTNPSDHVRYLLPLGVLLALPAGLLFEKTAAKPALRAMWLLLLAVPLVQALRLVWLLRAPDTRAQAEMLLERIEREHVGPWRLGIDHYGPVVDLDRDALTELRTWRPLRTREAHRLEWLEHDSNALAPGLPVVYAEELFGVDLETGGYGVRAERSSLGADPAQVLETLGVTHFLLVNRRPDDDDQPFLAPLTGAWTSLWSIDPSVDSGRAQEAFLPTEMEFALTALWRVRRAGPRLELFALRN